MAIYTGVTYHDEQLKYLLRLLNALPETIPIGDAHNFIGYSSECEARLAALDSMNDDVGSDNAPPPGSVSLSTLPLDRDGVDIRLPFLRDLLSDKLLEGADVIRSLGEWSGNCGLDIRTAGKAAGATVWDAEAELITF
ncbi:hypothetical protein B0H14DRAFT_3448124 [Mycena olivaceomarginata]|nr:hypothetical protein B0H14DRAFT_3448124 [Mycena olivaceomarginata]